MSELGKRGGTSQMRRSEMLNGKELILELDEISMRGPDPDLVDKAQASGLTISEAMTIAWNAALFTVLRRAFPEHE